ncbi:TonB-dependent receptor [Sphingomonas sp. CGMCC 1.13654]|uniref:TonB-dependent receptor n=1 Tax=Sphingomonas chungangi TaxID=2683589 RepID=A0A838L314_9SPHN|nr:TonB-dependent receptor [Sphingomonas chungangi]MBA2933574.1 TonB-dependent receptor [Sphingomonas chungangi]MVW54907.1 TonB-dependent receptor [Sphingomonas chungangi]
MTQARLYRSGVALGAIVAAGILAPAGAFAQQAAGASASAASAEIVVTAQRREQRLQDVPVAVAVATGDTMRKAQITDFNDLGNRLSGIKVNKGGPSDALNIRGIGSGFNMGFEQSVATFIDGVYISRSQSTRAGFLDLDRIEVLKGPQSTFFGSNAIAGALNVTTRKPTSTFEGYASGLYSPSDGEYDVQAAVGGPIGDGFSARAAARVSGMDGYLYNYRIDKKGPDNQDFQGRLALRYQVPGTLDINLRSDFTRLHDKHDEMQEVLNCPPAPGYGAPQAGCASLIAEGHADNKLDYHTAAGDSFFYLKSVNNVLSAAWTTGAGTLTSTTGYYWHEINRFVGQAVPQSAVVAVHSTSGLPITQPERFHSFSQEFRFESERGKFLEYTLGAYYDNSHLVGSESYGFYFAPFGARLPGVSPTEPIAQLVTANQHQQNRSVFAAATLHLTHKLRLNLGARYSSIHKTNDRTTIVGEGDDYGRVIPGTELSPAATTAFTAIGFPAGDYLVKHRTDDKFMPSINAQYDLTRNVMAYASYTTGFKAGGWAIGNGVDSFGPESVKSYELGLKASWFDKLLTTDIALYDARYKDLQESTTVYSAAGVPVSTIANVGKARSRGVDLDVRAVPLRGLSITASLGYLDARYLAYPNAPCTQLQVVALGKSCTQNLAGKRKDYAPDWSGSVNVDYSFALTGNLKADLAAWVYFTSGYYQQPIHDPLYYQSGYGKLDLRAAISDERDRWEIAVIAKNVTDKVTASYRASSTASNAVTAIVDRPRSIAVQVSTKF